MQVLNVSALPIYLPYDKAPVPFGDPFEDATITSSTTAVVTVPGYVPTAGDAVSFSIASGGGTIASGITVGAIYYVISPSTDTFAISTQKGGSAVATTTANSAADQVVVHLLSNQVDGVTQPFKPGASAVAFGLGAATTLYGAPDLNLGVGPPKGPGSFVSLGTIVSTGGTLVQLSYDWIKASSAGNVTLLQN